MDRNRDDLLANLIFVYQAYLGVGVNEVSGVKKIPPEVEVALFYKLLVNSVYHGTTPISDGIYKQCKAI